MTDYPFFKIESRQGKQVAVIGMGDREILLSEATGERGFDGAFLYLQLMTKVDDHKEGTGYPLHMASQFEDLWNYLKK